MPQRLCAILLLIFFPSILFSQKKNEIKIKSDDAHPLGFYSDDSLPDKTVYLTFDDGPSDWTDDIVNVLRKENVKGTFFICGDWAPKSDLIHNDFKKYKTILLRMIREGHVLGNHTIDHKNLAKITQDQIIKQLVENQELLNKEIGKEAPVMTIMRPPYGSPWSWHKPESYFTMLKTGKALKSRWIVAMWSRHFDSSDSMEWVRGEWYEEGPRISIETREFREKMRRIYNRIISNADGKGMVILFHDTHPTTYEVLPSVIKKLRSMGYTFATMEDFVKWKYGKSSTELVNPLMK